MNVGWKIRSACKIPTSVAAEPNPGGTNRAMMDWNPIQLEC
jgi:hypothetical protein